MPYARARGRISSRCFSADVVGRNRQCLDAEPSFFLAAPDRLRSTATARGTVSEAMLYAFDLLELDGEDLQARPLGGRKKRLARLLDGRRLGIVLSDHTDEDGALLFMHACRMGLEGIVSKRLSAPYRSGRSTDWLKVKNPDSPAMIRAREHFARLRQ
jgi:ATP-dependent DNA ligase